MIKTNAPQQIRQSASNHKWNKEAEVWCWRGWEKLRHRKREGDTARRKWEKQICMQRQRGLIPLRVRVESCHTQQQFWDAASHLAVGATPGAASAEHLASQPRAIQNRLNNCGKHPQTDSGPPSRMSFPAHTNQQRQCKGLRKYIHKNPGM